MARGVYTIPFTNLTIANAAITLAALRPGTTCALRILRMWATLKSGAAGAMERISVYEQPTTFPTVVAVTPVKTSQIDQASAIAGGTALAAGTCGVNASAEGGGAVVEKWSDSFHTFNGWLWTPQSPNGADVIILQPGSANCFGFRFAAAPATLIGWSGGIEFEEVG